jgi:hypothetical protein
MLNSRTAWGNTVRPVNMARLELVVVHEYAVVAKMGGGKFQIFFRQQIRDVWPEVPSRVLDDRIKLLVGMTIEPPAAIVDDDLQLLDCLSRNIYVN